MSIRLTPAAAERVEQFMSRDNGLGMRLGVRKTGCSGWAYEVDIATEIGAADSVFEDQGVKVVVDQNSLAMVEGTEIDFVREGLNRVFRFRNPNVVDECGCGESFTVG